MTKILDRIEQPQDLKTLTPEEVDQLCGEVREELVSTVTETGGHLASNLGTVELTLALHRVFDSPSDKIVWDVGHQAYVHKLVTGRRARFNTIRQYEGLCGFLERSESPHDVFGAGHAGTSVSAALGMALARDLNKERYHVVAVIGDGALTAGMALEALNHAGHVGVRLIVLLNDNQMSISPNVGALSRSFNKLRLDKRWMKAKEDAHHMITRLPMGQELWQASRKIKRSFKGMLYPSLIWEELGFDYIGPIDGHDWREVEAALEQAKETTTKPVLIHVLTKKGKGYEPAEEDAVKYHGVSPNGGKSSSTAPSYSKVFAQTVAALAKENPQVVAITAAMLEGTALQSVVKEMPGRIFDVGICEQHAVTLAGGLATQGIKPIVAIYSTFLQRAYDQVIHDICIQELPVVFAMDRGGIVGDDGKTHQGIFDFTYLRCLPNMVVSAPKDENELRHLLYTAVRYNGPFGVRFPRGNGFGVPLDSEFYEIPVGKGETLRVGKDVALVAIGATVYPALEAAKLLAERGVDCAVVNARFVKPLDRALILEMAQRTGRLVTIEEQVLMGGFGSAVLELLEEERLRGIQVERIGLPDRFIEHGSQKVLRAKYGVDTDGIVKAVLSLVSPVRVERISPAKV